MRLIRTAALWTAALLLTGCAAQTPAAPTETKQAAGAANETASLMTEETAMGQYETIAQDAAKRLMDTETGYLIVDVRTPEEFAGQSIRNAINLPLDQILAGDVAATLPDKQQLLLVYCRSGRRSLAAAQALAGMGYTNVKDFGGILTWGYDFN